MNNLGPLVTPDLRALLQMLMGEVATTLNCHQVGTIVSFDSTKQTAQIQIAMKRVVFNQEQQINGPLPNSPNFVDYPVLVDCPVFVYAGAGGAITMPVAAGDSCLVLFNDRDIDNWFTAGPGQTPNSQRTHDLSDGFAIVGFRNATNRIASYNGTDIEIRIGGGKFVAKATGDQSIISANGGEIDVGSLISVKNSATSLKTVLDDLCLALTSWVNTGGTTPNAGTVAAINAVKTLADSLLT